MMMAATAVIGGTHKLEVMRGAHHIYFTFEIMRAHSAFISCLRWCGAHTRRTPGAHQMHTAFYFTLGAMQGTLQFISCLRQCRAHCIYFMFEVMRGAHRAFISSLLFVRPACLPGSLPVTARQPASNCLYAASGT